VIVYLHGFNSSPGSFKARLVRQRLARLGRPEEFLCPALPWRFSAAVQVIEADLAQLAGRRVCLIGSSLGGFYATHFAERYGLPAILVNPAVRPYASLAAYLGPQQNLYTGERYVLEAGHIDELRALDPAAITHPERYLLLTQTGDEVLDYREGVARFAGALQVVVQGGDHAFSNFADYLDRVLAFADTHAAEVIIPAADG